ncbi:hypothetical protein [Trujillonella humicola]|uniref:hypothetical protein n=1 Tax=Trujillonella humicola TaxID=3383699 RepID=UPI0039069F1D
MVKRGLGLVAAIMVLTSACGGDGHASDAQASSAEPPPAVPGALTDHQSFTGITLPPEFDLADARGFRTVDAGAGTDGTRRDSWDVSGGLAP